MGVNYDINDSTFLLSVGIENDFQFWDLSLQKCIHKLEVKDFDEYEQRVYPEKLVVYKKEDDPFLAIEYEGEKIKIMNLVTKSFVFDLLEPSKLRTVFYKE